MEVKENCFAYNTKQNKCMALRDTYCTVEKCNFYKPETEVDKSEIKRSINIYSKYKK